MSDNNDLSVFPENDVPLSTCTTLPSSNDCDNSMPENSLFPEIRNVRAKNVRNIILAHININSLRHKFSEISIMLHEKMIDILVISEAKLDDSFTNNLFHVNGYCMYRQDNTAKSGGIVVFIKDCIANSCGKIKIYEKSLECITVDFIVDKNRYTLIAMYKHPKCPNDYFEQQFEYLYDKLTETGANTILMGDLNYNMLKDDCIMHDLCDRYDLTNIVNKPTCYKSANASLIDVILVSNRNLFMKTFVSDIHISDVHFMIGTVMRKYLPPPKVTYKTIRKFRNIKYDDVRKDIKEYNIIGAMQERQEASDKGQILQDFLVKIVDKYAPRKKIKINRDYLPKMSKELKSLILKRNMARNRFYKKRSKATFTEYRKIRNKVNIRKNKEFNERFSEKCKGGTRNGSFWKILKPYFNHKGMVRNEIMLAEGDNLRTDTTQICQIFSDYFVSLGCDIGTPEPDFEKISEIVKHYDNEPAVMSIRDIMEKRHPQLQNVFNFNHVSELEVLNVIKSLNGNKATGPDEIPASFIKSCASELAPPLTALINECIWQNIFPCHMKVSNIIPLYKKKDALCKENYRSVNILTSTSKIFERIMYNQMYEYFSTIFHKLISGFRKGHSCNSVLLKLTEDIRKSLDQGFCMGMVAMDLSKAFDVIPRGLFIAKLQSYGFTSNACKLMFSYMTERKQRVKIGEITSTWAKPQKGVPQGSILGPLIFNIFMNDFLYLHFDSSVYNYADDNTLAVIGPEFNTVISKLELDAQKAVKWFSENKMQANPEKFQFMFLGKDVTSSLKLQVCGTNLEPSDSIDILGVTLDSKLKFNIMVKEICKKTSCQLNVLQRLKSNLDKESRMAVYNAFIISNMLYCQLVWMHCGMANIKKLEKVNERALKFVNRDNKSDYEVQLIKADKNRLLTNRVINMSIEVYKAKVGISPIYLQELFVNEFNPYNLRASNTLVLPKYRTRTFGYRSFAYMGAKIWNQLTNDLRESPTLPLFRERMKIWAAENLKI